jgi:hypothetical protein
VNVASFVDSQLEYNVDWSTLPIAVLEIVMRVNKLEPDVARTMLTDLIAGRLTFRGALKRESDLRERIPSEIAQEPQSSTVNGGPKMRAIVRSALELSKNESLVQIKPNEDWRFPLVKSHAVFLAPEIRSASLFSEAMLSGAVSPWRPFQEMLGSVFAACSLFKVVVVWLLRDESADEVLRYLERSECKPRNLVLVVGPQLLRKDALVGYQ